MRERLEAAIAGLQRLGGASSRLGARASGEAIAALEAQVGPLPAVYRAFLALHDGWEGMPGHTAARLFSCADFARPEIAATVAAFRGARGHKTNREIQTALVIGASIGAGPPAETFVLLAPAAKGKKARRPDVVRTYGWSTRGSSQGDAADIAAFFERRAQLLASAIAEATHDEASPLDAAIAAFNDPDENGERPDEANAALQALLARLEPSAPVRPLVALLARELWRDTFTRARRAGEGIELWDARHGVWLPGVG